MVLLQAVGAGTGQYLIMFGMIFAVMYFFMIRPQIKKQKKDREYRSALQKGDKVITIGGLHGKIIDIKERTFIIETHGRNTIKIEKESVSMSGLAIEQK